MAAWKRSQESWVALSTASALSLPVLLIALAVAMSSCGGGGSTSSTPPSGGPPPSVTVSVSPSSPSVILGNAQQFSATVTGSSNTAVTWSVNNVAGGNSSVGTITSAGLYTAPADLPNPASVTVTATSQAMSSASGSSTVTVTSDIKISVTASAASVQPGARLQLTATISSSGHPDQSVTWSVDGVAGGNSADGVVASTGTDTATYTAPPALPSPYTVAIQASSKADTSENATASVIIAGTIASATQSISAAQGGTITLPDGSSVTIPVGALSADQQVSLSEVSVLPQQPPDLAINGVGPALVLTVSKPNLYSAARRRSGLPSVAQLSTDGPAPGPKRVQAEVQDQASSGSSDLQFTINASQNTVSGLQGSAPMADLYDLFGNHNFSGVSGAYDSTAKTAGLTVPSSLLANVQTVYVSMANFVQTAQEQLYNGPLTWTGSQWTQNPSDTCPNLPSGNGRVLVLVHGLFSSCQGAFPCAESILKAGNYGAAVGFNYDYSQDINQSGSQLAGYLNTLALCPGVTGVDIEAHSEGVPVSMSAATKAIPQAQQKIANFVSLGGPIMGTPVANSANDMLTSQLNLGGTPIPAGTLLQSITGQNLTGLATGSSEMATTRATFAQDLPMARVVMAGGTQVGGFLLGDLFGSLFPGVAFDGIIGVNSALPSNSASGLSNVEQLPPYPLSHTQLECNNSVIQEVGQAVQGPSTAAQSLVASPASLAFRSTEGGTNPAAQPLTVIDTAGTQLTWSAAVSGGAGWLSVSPTSGTTTGTALVTANAAGLSPGAYGASITFSVPGDPSLTGYVPVTLTVLSSAGTYDLDVSFLGTGQGTVYVANLSGGNALGTGSCGTDCLIYPAGTELELGENPELGSTFAGWGGACTGTGPCLLTMNSDQSVTATFNQAASGGSQYNLTVSIGGTGSGTVSESPTGTPCGSGCYSYAAGTAVQLTGTPASGSTFVGWGGACSGTGGCTVTMNQNQSVTATFNSSGGGTQYTLTVGTAGTGSGTATSTPTGIACPNTCSANFASGTSVTLTATPATGSTFAGWSGACSGTGGCTVTMNQNQSVAATFNLSTGSGQQIGVNGANVAFISGSASCTLSSGGVFDNCSGSVTLNIQSPITTGSISAAVGNTAGTNFINCGASVTQGSTPGTINMACAGPIPQGTCPPGGYMVVGDDNTRTIGEGTVNFGWTCGPGSVARRQ